MLPIDYSPLTVPVTPAEVTTYRSLAGGSGQASARNSALPVVVAVVVGVILLPAIAIAGLLALLLTASVDPAWGIAGAIVPAALLGFGVFSVYRAVLARREPWERKLRLSRFAAANELGYSDRSEAPVAVDAAFSARHPGVCADRLRSIDGMSLDAGNYENGATRGYLALQLPAVHAGFAPGAELLQPLLEGGAPLRQQLVGDTLVVTAADRFDSLDPGLWARIFAIAEAAGYDQLSVARRSLAAQGTGRHEPRRASNTVSRPGRKVERRRGLWLALLILGVLVVLPVLVIAVAAIVGSVTGG
jgi:hypothetical protein